MQKVVSSVDVQEPHSLSHSNVLPDTLFDGTCGFVVKVPALRTNDREPCRHKFETLRPFHENNTSYPVLTSS